MTGAVEGSVETFIGFAFACCAGSDVAGEGFEKNEDVDGEFGSGIGSVEEGIGVESIEEESVGRFPIVGPVPGFGPVVAC